MFRAATCKQLPRMAGKGGVSHVLVHLDRHLLRYTYLSPSPAFFLPRVKFRSPVLGHLRCPLKGRMTRQPHAAK